MNNFSKFWYSFFSKGKTICREFRRFSRKMLKMLKFRNKPFITTQSQNVSNCKIPQYTCLSTCANKTVIHRLNSDRSHRSPSLSDYLRAVDQNEMVLFARVQLADTIVKRLRPFPSDFMFTPKNIINIYLFVNFSRRR